ncbi:MAG: hypothetical protein CR966_01285 [Pseudomonadales bacterium]|nr:MAG: hypothetical protein CR966_01285 [Pseudomonadales bacterium]
MMSCNKKNLNCNEDILDSQKIIEKLQDGSLLNETKLENIFKSGLLKKQDSIEIDDQYTTPLVRLLILTYFFDCSVDNIDKLINVYKFKIAEKCIEYIKTNTKNIDDSKLLKLYKELPKELGITIKQLFFEIESQLAGDISFCSRIRSVVVK